MGALEELAAVCADYPREPDFLCRRAGVLMALGRMDEARDMAASACAIGPGWGEFLMRLADVGIVPVSREILKQLVPPSAKITTEDR